MFRRIYLVLILLSSRLLPAQQLPQYSQYIWNNYLINPAVAGAENFMEIKGGYRNQWVGMEGAPRTLFFTVQGQIGKKLENNEYIDVVDKSLDKKQNSGLRKVLNVGTRNYSKPPAHYTRSGHHGIGGQLLNDRIGPFNISAFYLTYAYHLPISEKLTVALGATGGAKQYRLDPRYINFGDNVTDISATPSNPSYGISPDGSIGAMLYSERFYLGVATDQIFGNKLSIANISNSSKILAKIQRHYFFNAGYRIKLSSDFALVPSTLVRIYPDTPLSADFTAKLNYLDIIWCGASYRPHDAFVCLLGLSINKHLDIGYSYDINSSILRNFNQGSHEFIIGYRLINKKTNDCRPSYTW